MAREHLYSLAADAVLLAHILFVAFVVFGLMVIYAGRILAWGWVRNPWFRLTHLVAISIVVIQSWLSIVCPLTTWEMAFRAAAGESVYAGSFISHWLHTILYYRAPAWVFAVGYTIFGGLVLASWYWVPPRPFSTSHNEHQHRKPNHR